MPVLEIESEFGECVPPVTPNGITTNIPGWDLAVGLREGDMSVFSRLKNIYPRILPFGAAAQLIGAVSAKLSGIPEGYHALAFLHPSSFDMVRRYAFGTMHKKPEWYIAPEELVYRVVDIRGVRLYFVYFPPAKMFGIIGAWQNPGTGISWRLGEDLLPHVDEMVEVECDKEGLKPPGSKYLPECAAHPALRERIAGLLHRAARDPTKIKATAEDVFLYPTGMAAIYWLHEHLTAYRPGTPVYLGALFHNTYHHGLVYAEPPLKHLPDVSAAGLDTLSTFLDSEAQASRHISYLFVEFPSNPIMECADLWTLQDIARRHGCPLVVDDTIGSFSNVDLLPVADILMTSLTKSFSGFSDVMAGSNVLNPLSSHYAPLRDIFTQNFCNEFHANDAEVLLKNSDSYLPRSAILGRNGTNLATHLDRLSKEDAVPITLVRHTATLPSSGKTYAAFHRQPTAEYTPQDPCLITVDFASLATAKAFYEALALYATPHLGAHKTLMLAYNTLVFGRAFEREYHRSYGILDEAVRISVGLEEWEDLKDTVDVAVKAACEAWEKEKGKNEV
jgi:cystathionine gamma-synthase